MSPCNSAVLLPPGLDSARRVNRTGSCEGGDSLTSGRRSFPSTHTVGSGKSEPDEFADIDSGLANSGTVIFEAKPKFPSPNVVKRTLGELLDLMNGLHLELNPECRRDANWSAQRMVGLIDSLMENCPIPPVIFSMERIAGSGGTFNFKRVCLDGKQRLSSTKAFVEGRIGCHDAKGSTWYYGHALDDSGKSTYRRDRKILPDCVKEEFRQKELVCYEILDLSRSQGEDLFSRVQFDIQVGAAEQLRTISCRWQELAKEFEHDYPTVTRLSIPTRAPKTSIILLCFAQILECQHPTEKRGKPAMKHGFKTLEKFGLNSEPLTTATESHLHRVFTIFQELVEQDPETFVDPSNRDENGRNFATMEMVAVAVLISQHEDTRNHYLLLDDIKAMRMSIRGLSSDAVLSRTTWENLWDFIESLKPPMEALDKSQCMYGTEGIPDIATHKRKLVELASGKSDKRLCLEANPASKPDLDFQLERSWNKVVRGGPGRHDASAPASLSRRMPIRSVSPDSVIGVDEDDSDESTLEEAPGPPTFHKAIHTLPKPQVDQLNPYYPNTAVTEVQDPLAPLEQKEIIAEMTTPSQQSCRRIQKHTTEHPTVALVQEPLTAEATGRPLPQQSTAGDTPAQSTQAQADVQEPDFTRHTSPSTLEVPIHAPEWTPKSRATASTQQQPAPIPDASAPLQQPLNPSPVPSPKQTSPRPVSSSVLVQQTPQSPKLAPRETSQPPVPTGGTPDTPLPDTVDVKPNVVPYFNTFQSGGAKALAERRRLAREARLNRKT